jgi:hypothetical protein
MVSRFGPAPVASRQSGVDDWGLVFGKCPSIRKMDGRGGGDRTTKGVEEAQVIDSVKRQKGEKPQKG